MKEIIGLVIETSCDETAVCVISGGREILANVVLTQIDIHKEYGGVVPEIASREHTAAISYVVDMAMKQANKEYNDLAYIGVTYGPGLIGALLVGVSFAKSLAYMLNLPIVPVHHIKGHIAANYITHPTLEPPFLALVVSGGHSHLISVKTYTEMEIIARTRDDAAGEAFDKVARTLGLPYPGGPEVSRLAKLGERSYILPKTKFDNYDFSFSGIKTAVINIAHKENEKLRPNDMCRSFEETVCETLVEHTIKAMQELGFSKVVLAGGVSANDCLRAMLEEKGKEIGASVYIPALKYCTDNAAMIASQAYYEYIVKGKEAFSIHQYLDLNAVANLEINQ